MATTVAVHPPIHPGEILPDDLARGQARHTSQPSLDLRSHAGSRRTRCGRDRRWCANIAEVEHGLRPKERKSAAALLDRLDFLETTPEAGRRAGRHQADLQRQGQTIHTPDALVAGTARVHGAVVVTDNRSDFPMTDVTSEAPPSE
jgi:predicted nucleic acid-binding protein